MGGRGFGGRSIVDAAGDGGAGAGGLTAGSAGALQREEPQRLARAALKREAAAQRLARAALKREAAARAGDQPEAGVRVAAFSRRWKRGRGRGRRGRFAGRC